MATGETFTNASLQGTYAFSGTGRGGQAPLAAIGLLTFDGTGTVSGLVLESLPGERFGDRRIAERPAGGTYAVEPNGTGTTRPPGGGDPELLVAITRVDTIGGRRIAGEFGFVAGALDPVTGNLLTGLATAAAGRGGVRHGQPQRHLFRRRDRPGRPEPGGRVRRAEL